MSEAKAPETWLVFGSTGWIGGMMCDLLAKDATRTVTRASSRIENREDCARELDAVKPDRVINCAGLTGRPNVDWCEDHKEEVLRVNVMGTISLVDLCKTRGLHITNFATGCIYSYDDEHPIGGKRFTEEDPANFFGSFYSYTKGLVEKLLLPYDNILILRLRMPISADLSDRNFVTKISRYAKVCNVPNSMTILDDLLPVAVIMAERKLTGVFNFTNPDPISHNEILDLYKEHIDPDFWYENFTEAEQSLILKAGRSNNTLDTSKIVAALPDVHIPSISESITSVFIRMKAALLAEGRFPPPAAKKARVAAAAE